VITGSGFKERRDWSTYNCDFDGDFDGEKERLWLQAVDSRKGEIEAPTIVILTEKRRDWRKGEIEATTIVILTEKRRDCDYRQWIQGKDRLKHLELWFWRRKGEIEANPQEDNKEPRITIMNVTSE
jgi:hypothetical protein